MSLFVKKLLGVGAAVAVLGVLIGLYVADWATSFPKTVAAAGAPATSGGSQPDARDGRVDRPEVQPVAPQLGLLPGQQPRPVGAQHRLHGPGQLDRARHDLPVRHAHRPAQPVPRRRCRGRSAATDDHRRQDRQHDRPRRSVAHVRRARARRVRAAARACPKKPRTCAKKRPANRRRATTARSRSASGRARRAATAGSASCPAAPAVLFGNGGPMQTLGYMDGFINVV